MSEWTGEEWQEREMDSVYRQYVLMLSEYKVKQLRSIAQTRQVSVTGTFKGDIVQTLAIHLADVENTRRAVAKLDALSLDILFFMHLKLSTGYGMPMSNIEPLSLALAPSNPLLEDDEQSVSRLLKTILDQEQDTDREETSNYTNAILSLINQGLILTFMERRVAYYSLPDNVRAALPPFSMFAQPGSDPFSSETQIIPQGRDYLQRARSLGHVLYSLWNKIDSGQIQSLSPTPSPGDSEIKPRHHKKESQTRSRLADRIEARWEHLAGWLHDPDEIEEIKALGPHFYRSKPALTVPVPSYSLSKEARQQLCSDSKAPKSLGNLSRSTDEQIEFYVMLLKELGRVRKSDETENKPFSPPSPWPDHATMQEMLQQATDVQLGILFEFWRSTLDWNEMDIVLRAAEESDGQRLVIRRNAAYQKFKRSHLYKEWSEARLTVLRFLSLLHEGRWVSLNTLLRTIYTLLPYLAHMLTDPNVWWIEIAAARGGTNRGTRRKQLGTTWDDWMLGFGHLAQTIFTGPLFWFGAVDLGYVRENLVVQQSSDDPSDADVHESQIANHDLFIRLTPVGSLLLGRRDSLETLTPNALSEREIKLTNDLRAMVPTGTPSVCDILSHIGRLEHATPDGLIYQMRVEAVQRALESGETAERLIDALQSLCPEPLPAAWIEKLKLWQHNLGRMRIYENLTLIELADDYALQELLNSTHLSQAVIHQFSPRLVAVRADAVDALMQEMEQRGHTPRLTDHQSRMMPGGTSRSSTSQRI